MQTESAASESAASVDAPVVTATDLTKIYGEGESRSVPSTASPSSSRAASSPR